MDLTTRVCRLHGQGDIRIEEEPVARPGPREALVRVGAGGVCGSDLHYYQDGGFGPIRVREPIILGHEFAGVVEAVGAEVEGLAEGDRVAVNPSHPCGRCEYCREGLFQHCLEMRFLGSALRTPHTQGGFRDRIVVAAEQCVPVGSQTSLAAAACAEPLAVCLHAVNRAGDLSGRRVLVTGAGPIGALTVAAAKRAGAAEIVVTDLQDAPLRVAEGMGATQAVNVGREAEGLAPWMEAKGRIDVAFECSAAPAALRTALAATRPQGTVVQVGVAGDLPIPVNVLVGKEISLVGSHRFHAEFREAAQAIASGEVDVAPILTHTFPLEKAVEAFAVAGDRSQAVKVQLAFAD